MRNWMWAILGAVVLSSTSATAEYCTKKRVDKCGCHHAYGVRHCHPNRKTDHCEAPVKHQAPAPKDAPKKNAPIPT